MSRYIKNRAMRLKKKKQKKQTKNINECLIAS